MKTENHSYNDQGLWDLPETAKESLEKRGFIFWANSRHVVAFLGAHEEWLEKATMVLGEGGEP